MADDQQGCSKRAAEEKTRRRRDRGVEQGKGKGALVKQHAIAREFYK